VDDGLLELDYEAEQHHRHRVRRDVSNNNSNIEMSSSAMLAMVTRNDDDDANIYDNSEYYGNIYDEPAAYDDYQLHSSQSHYNKVRHVTHSTRKFVTILITFAK